MKRNTKIPRTYIREWRHHRKLTIEQLAERVDKSIAWLSQLERSKHGYSPESLAALADALGIETADIFRDPNAPDYESWRIIKNLSQDKQKQALRVLRAMTEDAA